MSGAHRVPYEWSYFIRPIGNGLGDSTIYLSLSEFWFGSRTLALIYTLIPGLSSRLPLGCIPNCTPSLQSAPLVKSGALLYIGNRVSFGHFSKIRMQCCTRARFLPPNNFSLAWKQNKKNAFHSIRTIKWDSKSLKRRNLKNANILIKQLNDDVRCLLFS